MGPSSRRQSSGAGERERTRALHLRLPARRARGAACQRHDRPPTASGPLEVDRVALRSALGGRAEVIEAINAKATGRPGVNAWRVWAFMTTSVYQSGDLPLLATREALQNGVDAIKAAIRTRKTRAGDGRFEVTWDPERRALTWEDNGIGMDADTILSKFLSLGDSGKRNAGDSEEAAGGFGVAKARDPRHQPHLPLGDAHARNNLAVSEGADVDVQVFDAPHRQGTRITIFDVPDDFDTAWDYARQAYVPLTDRLRELLAANDLPDITLVLDGEVVAPNVSRRGARRYPSRARGDAARPRR